MDVFISIVGSIASIFGAIWAWQEATKSKEHASKAEKFRDELVHRKNIAEVSKLHIETSRILKLVSKVGPTCTKNGVRGVKGDEIAREVEEYTRFLNEHSIHFSDFFHNNAKELCGSLRPLLESLSEATDFEQKKNSGKQIYDLINGFLPEIKNLSDVKNNQILVTA